MIFYALLEVAIQLEILKYLTVKDLNDMVLVLN